MKPVTEARTSEPAPQLEYALPPPLHRRRGFRRAVIASTLLVLLALGWVQIPRVWHRAKILYWQREWMSFQMPPTRVVLEPDAAKAKALWTAGSNYVTRPPGGVYYVPPLAGSMGECVFLHGRRRPDGTLRLIKVSEWYDAQRPNLVAAVIRPATFFNSSLDAFGHGTSYPPGPAGERPRLYAGQPDPNDPSRFTIKYEYSDRSGSIRGALRDDDSVVFDHAEDEVR